MTSVTPMFTVHTRSRTCYDPHDMTLSMQQMAANAKNILIVTCIWQGDDDNSEEEGPALAAELFEEDGNTDLCVLCGLGGSLLCCDGCPAAYHMRCIGETAKSIPEGEWLCPECSVGGRGTLYIINPKPYTLIIMIRTMSAFSVFVPSVPVSVSVSVCVFVCVCACIVHARCELCLNCWQWQAAKYSIGRLAFGLGAAVTSGADLPLVLCSPC